MIYLYAHTNHKENLDSLRRMGALWHALKQRGVEAEILVNDFRAQLAGRELGLPLATTIETILDIDAVAEHGDTVVIDSPEDAGERLAFFVERFSGLYRVARSCGEASLAGETVLPQWRTEGEELWVDASYLRAQRQPKASRVLLIYGDSDADKRLLAHRELFVGLNLELYWGLYFYVKYEEALQEVFPVIHESEEYRELVSGSETVVTASFQTALEARAAGAGVIYLAFDPLEACRLELLERLQIFVLGTEDREALRRAIEASSPAALECRSFAENVAEMLVP